MKTLIIYDSQYGNTKLIAQAIYEELSTDNDVKLVSTEEAQLTDLDNIELLIVGSPTQGGRAKQTLQDFLQTIPEGSLKDVNIAAFDTRFLEKDLNFALRLLVKTIGYAAPKISDLLISKGGVTAISPEGFIVKKNEGPLAEGEAKRAKDWAGQIIGNIQNRDK